MIAHLLRALFRRIDARLDRMVADALDDDLCAVMDATAEPVARAHATRLVRAGLSVCPTCHAVASAPCRTTSGTRARRRHAGRP